MSRRPVGQEDFPPELLDRPTPDLPARFLPLRRLGAGGGGAVWLAHDLERDARIAVKLVTGGPARRAALERLQATLAELDDPHILRLDEIIAAGEDTWLAMEYAAGGDASRLRGCPWAQVVQTLLPIARALARLHRHGIVHRDVKATNVLLMADGTPRLADFEAALRIHETAGERTTPGSRYSMSPQSLQGEPTAVADDVYGFGALLYELLSGYPPFYPHGAPEQIRYEAPARIDARLPLPAELQALVARCLRKAPSERPGSMEEIEAQLRCVLKLARATGDAGLEQLMSTNEPQSQPSSRPRTPEIRPPSGPAEPLRSEWRRTAPRSARSSERLRSHRRALQVLSVAISALALFTVFFLLPKWVPTGTSAPQAPAAAARSAPNPAPRPVAQVDFAALARAKQQADELRGPLFDRLESLRARAVERWAAEDFVKATQTLAEADAEYAKRAYIEAVEHLARLEPQLEALEARASSVLEQQLAAGAQALAEGRSQDARAAFELALVIEPKHAAAERGLARAATLDQVLELLNAAQRAEQDGDLEEALAHYRRAVELDKDMSRAAEGVARVSARLAGDAFASAMARGFAALGSGDYAAARAVFQSAGTIRPGSTEVAAALKQVEQNERTRTIAEKLDAARAAEGSEKWADALQSYKDILSLDPTVAAAKEGVARVQPRAELNERLELYLTQPERLFSAPVRRAAHETLARAGEIAEPGPVLSQQVAKLREWLARAEVPVPVALESDNLTQVTIYRVGALGTFERRSLELVPGEYTIVGTRPGYRDVRRRLVVTPGTPPPPIVIRCEEKI